MNDYLVFKFLHLLAFVYWLGGDLGTFLSSRHIVRDDIGVESRAVALKIMLACDQCPRSCMPLIFPLGLQLGQIGGFTSLPAWGMALVWLVCLVWFANVQYLYFTDNRPGKARVARFDFGLRLAVIAAVLVYAGGSLGGTGWVAADWVAWKMIIFAALVACGLLIRVKLEPFVAAFGQLMAGGATAEVNRAMTASLQRVLPWVWLIWLGLLLNAAIGLRVWS